MSAELNAVLAEVSAFLNSAILALRFFFFALRFFLAFLRASFAAANSLSAVVKAASAFWTVNLAEDTLSSAAATSEDVTTLESFELEAATLVAFAFDEGVAAAWVEFEKTSSYCVVMVV